MKAKLFLSASLFVTLFLTACLQTAVPDSTPSPPAETAYPAPPTSPPDMAYPPPALDTEPAPTNIASDPVAEAERLAQITAIKAAITPETIQRFENAGAAHAIEILRYACVLPPGSDFEIALEELVVREVGGEIRVAGQQLLNCGGLGAFGYSGMGWSVSSRYFYFHEGREGVPDGGPCGLWQPTPSRLDIETMQIEQLPGFGPSTAGGGQFLLWTSSDFVLWDLETGELQRSALPEKGFYLFSMDISPDGRRMVYVLRSECFAPEARTIIGLLELPSFSHTVLLDTPANGYMRAIWESENTVILTDLGGSTYLFNLETRESKPQE